MAWDRGLSPQMGRSALNVKHTGQESGGEFCGNFQILIVSAVKICKQCLQVQTASASGGLCPSDLLPGFRPWTPLGDFHPQTLWAIVPK